MTDNDGTESILGQVQPSEWDDQQAISFEVAQDTISLFIAHCTDRYWTERRKEVPDQSVMEYWDEQSRIASVDRHALRADDPAAIRAVRDTYGARLLAAPLVVPGTPLKAAAEGRADASFRAVGGMSRARSAGLLPKGSSEAASARPVRARGRHTRALTRG